MTSIVSSMEEIMAALPAVQEAVRQEIAGRIAAGEDIAALDTEWPRRNLPSLEDRRKRLIADWEQAQRSNPAA